MGLLTEDQLSLISCVAPNACTSDDDGAGQSATSSEQGGVCAAPADGGQSQAPQDGGISQAPQDGGISQAPQDGGISQAPQDGGASQAPAGVSTSQDAPSGGTPDPLDGGTSLPGGTTSDPPSAGTPDPQDPQDAGTAETTPVNPTGAQFEEQPPAPVCGGLPTFRYNAPTVPIAEAVVDTPAARVEITLSLRGNVAITFADAYPGVSTDVDTQGFRVEATKALGPITEGMRVSGLNTGSPSIGVTMGSRYDTIEVRFQPPNSMLYIGQATVSYERNTPLGKATVKGQFGADLKITVYPKVQTSPEPTNEYEWHTNNASALAAIGALALMALAIAAAPETGGGSLVLLAL